MKDTVEVQGKGGDNDVTGGNIAQPLDAKGADLGIVQGIGIFALIYLYLYRLLTIVYCGEGVTLGYGIGVFLRIRGMYV